MHPSRSPIGVCQAAPGRCCFPGLDVGRSVVAVSSQHPPGSAHEPSAEIAGPQSIVDHLRGGAPDLHAFDWVDDSDANGYMFSAYCLTLMPQLTIAELVELLPVSPTIVGECDYPTLEDRGLDIFNASGGVGLLAVENGVVMFEPNGYVGVSPPVMGPVSAGRTAVSHYRGGHGVTNFHWYVNGEVATDFEPFQPSGRGGTHPDVLVPLMQSIGGFALNPDDWAYGDDSWLDLPHDQAAFALAEALTGIPITLDLLRQSTYLSIHVPIPEA